MPEEKEEYKVDPPGQDEKTHYQKSMYLLNVLYGNMDRTIRQHKIGGVAQLDAGVLAAVAQTEALLEIGTDLERIAAVLENLYEHGLITVDGT